MLQLPNEAASGVRSTPHQRAATKQTARQAAAHAGCDDMVPPAALLALRTCVGIRRGSRLASGAISSETRLMRGCIRLLESQPRSAFGRRQGDTVEHVERLCNR